MLIFILASYEVFNQSIHCRQQLQNFYGDDRNPKATQRSVNITVSNSDNYLTTVHVTNESIHGLKNIVQIPSHLSKSMTLTPVAYRKVLVLLSKLCTNIKLLCKYQKNPVMDMGGMGLSKHQMRAPMRTYTSLVWHSQQATKTMYTERYYYSNWLILSPFVFKN